MKNKRLLSLFLAATLAFSSLPITMASSVSAAEPWDITYSDTTVETSDAAQGHLDVTAHTDGKWEFKFPINDDDLVKGTEYYVFADFKSDASLSVRTYIDGRLPLDAPGLWADRGEVASGGTKNVAGDWDNLLLPAFIDYAKFYGYKHKAGTGAATNIDGLEGANGYYKNGALAVADTADGTLTEINKNDSKHTGFEDSLSYVLELNASAKPKKTFGGALNNFTASTEKTVFLGKFKVEGATTEKIDEFTIQPSRWVATTASATFTFDDLKIYTDYAKTDLKAEVNFDSLDIPAITATQNAKIEHNFTPKGTQLDYDANGKATVTLTANSRFGAGLYTFSADVAEFNGDGDNTAKVVVTLESGKTITLSEAALPEDGKLGFTFMVEDTDAISKVELISTGKEGEKFVVDNVKVEKATLDTANIAAGVIENDIAMSAEYSDGEATVVADAEGKLVVIRNEASQPFMCFDIPDDWTTDDVVEVSFKMAVSDDTDCNKFRFYAGDRTANNILRGYGQFGDNGSQSGVAVDGSKIFTVPKDNQTYEVKMSTTLESVVAGKDLIVCFSRDMTDHDGNEHSGTFTLDDLVVENVTKNVATGCDFDAVVPEGYNKLVGDYGEGAYIQTHVPAKVSFEHDFSPAGTFIDLAATADGAVAYAEFTPATLAAGTYEFTTSLATNVADTDATAWVEVIYADGTTVESKMVDLANAPETVTVPFIVLDGEANVEAIKIYADGEVGDTLGVDTAATNLVKTSSADAVIVRYAAGRAEVAFAPATTMGAGVYTYSATAGVYDSNESGIENTAKIVVTFDNDATLEKEITLGEASSYTFLVDEDRTVTNIKIASVGDTDEILVVDYVKVEEIKIDPMVYEDEVTGNKVDVNYVGADMTYKALSEGYMYVSTNEKGNAGDWNFVVDIPASAGLKADEEYYVYFDAVSDKDVPVRIEVQGATVVKPVAAEKPTGNFPVWANMLFAPNENYDNNYTGLSSGWEYRTVSSNTAWNAFAKIFSGESTFAAKMKLTGDQNGAITIKIKKNDGTNPSANFTFDNFEIYKGEKSVQNNTPVWKNDFNASGAGTSVGGSAGAKYVCTPSGAYVDYAESIGDYNAATVITPQSGVTLGSGVYTFVANMFISDDIDATENEAWGEIVVNDDTAEGGKAYIAIDAVALTSETVTITKQFKLKDGQTLDSIVIYSNGEVGEKFVIGTSLIDANGGVYASNEIVEEEVPAGKNENLLNTEIAVSQGANYEIVEEAQGHLALELNGLNASPWGDFHIPVALKGGVKYHVEFDVSNPGANNLDFFRIEAGQTVVKGAPVSGSNLSNHANTDTSGWGNHLQSPDGTYNGDNGNNWGAYNNNCSVFYLDKEVTGFHGVFTLVSDAKAGMTIPMLKNMGTMTGSIVIDNFVIYADGETDPVYACDFDSETPEKFDAVFGEEGSNAFFTIRKKTTSRVTAEHVYSAVCESVEYVETTDGRNEVIVKLEPGTVLDASVYTVSADVYSDQVDGGEAWFEVDLDNGSKLESKHVALTDEAKLLTLTFATEGATVDAIRLVSTGELETRFVFANLALRENVATDDTVLGVADNNLLSYANRTSTNNVVKTSTGNEVPPIYDVEGNLTAANVAWDVSALELTKGEYEFSVDIAADEAADGSEAWIEVTLNDGTVISSARNEEDTIDIPKTQMNNFDEYENLTFKFKVPTEKSIASIAIKTTETGSFYFRNESLIGRIDDNKRPSFAAVILGLLIIEQAKADGSYVEPPKTGVNLLTNGDLATAPNIVDLGPTAQTEADAGFHQRLSNQSKVGTNITYISENGENFVRIRDLDVGQRGIYFNTGVVLQPGKYEFTFDVRVSEAETDAHYNEYAWLDTAKSTMMIRSWMANPENVNAGQTEAFKPINKADALNTSGNVTGTQVKITRDWSTYTEKIELDQPTLAIFKIGGGMSGEKDSHGFDLTNLKLVRVD